MESGTIELGRMRSTAQLGAFFIVALLTAASMWFYVDRILVGYQVADAAAHERPRGNLSDLYPRWLDGRALDPAKPEDPKDQEGFAYPVYVVFLLAPVIGLSFHEVQIFFHWLLLGLTVASVWLWLHGLR